VLGRERSSRCSLMDLVAAQQRGTSARKKAQHRCSLMDQDGTGRGAVERKNAVLGSLMFSAGFQDGT
jgi:hypothetical protein